MRQWLPAASVSSVGLVRFLRDTLYESRGTSASTSSSTNTTWNRTVRSRPSIKVEPGICEVLTTYSPGFWDAGVPREKLHREWSEGDEADRSRRAVAALRDRLDGPILFCGFGPSCLGISKAFGGGGYVGYSSFSHFRPSNDGEWNVLVMEMHLFLKSFRKQSLSSAR